MNLPDRWNPIFVLRTRRFFGRIVKFRLLLLAATLLTLGFGVVLSWRAWESEAYEHYREMAEFIAYFLTTAFALRGAVLPGIQYLREVSEEDLSRFSGMEPKAIVRGYTSIGAFFPALSCLLGTLFLITLNLFDPHSLLSVGIRVIVIFMFSQVVKTVLFAFFTLVRNEKESMIVSLLLCFLIVPGLCAFGLTFLAMSFIVTDPGTFSLSWNEEWVFPLMIILYSIAIYGLSRVFLETNFEEKSPFRDRIGFVTIFHLAFLYVPCCCMGVVG